MNMKRLRFAQHPVAAKARTDPRASIWRDGHTVRRNPMQSVILTSSCVDADQAFRALRNGESDSMPTPGIFGDIQMTVTDEWMHGVRWFADSERPCALLLRTMTIPQAFVGADNDEPHHFSFLAAVQLGADGAIDPDLLKNATIIDATYGNRPILIGAIAVVEQADTTHAVRYQISNPTPKETDRSDRVFWREARPVAEAYEPWADAQGDWRIVMTGAMIVEYYARAYAAAEAASKADRRLMPHYNGVGAAERTIWNRVLQPLFGTIDALDRASADAPRDLGTVDATLLGPRAPGDTPIDVVDTLQRGRDVLHVTAQRGRIDLDWPASLMAERMTAHAQLRAHWEPHEREYTFRDKSLTIGAVLQRLREEPEASTRAALYRHVLLAHGSHHAKPGHLFDTAEQLEAMAQRAFGQSYADLIYRERFGMTSADAILIAMGYMQETAAEARDYVALLKAQQRRTNPGAGDRIAMHDVSYLAEQVILAEAGLSASPTLTLEQQYAIAMQLYREMGIDFTQAPWNQYVRDPRKAAREWKQAGSGSAVPGTLDWAYLHMNFDPTGLSASRVETEIHEHGHIANFLASHSYAGRFMQLRDLRAGSDAWPEGIAITLQELLHHPAIAQRLLGQLDGFTPQYLEVYARVSRLEAIWRRRWLFLMAMQEIMLYRPNMPGDVLPPGQTQLTREQRLAYWPQWVRDHLFVEPPEDVPYGDWVSRQHFTSAEWYLYYGAYPMGTVLAQKIAQRHITDGTPEELRAFGAEMIPYLACGSRMDPAAFNAASRGDPLPT